MNHSPMMKKVLDMAVVKFEDDKIDIDEVLVNQIRIFAADNGGLDSVYSDLYKTRGYDIIGTDRLYQWAIDKGFRRIMDDAFVLFDAENTAIAKLTLSESSFHLFGLTDLVKEFAHFAKDSFKPKVFDIDVLQAIELTGFTDRGPQFKKSELKRIHDLKPEYYPFLDGGFEALLHDFIMSDESVLILGGVPGTGKSVGMREVMIKLGIQPVIAQDAQAISHPMFINTIFSVYDSMYKGSTSKESDTVYESDWTNGAKQVVEEIMPLNESNHGKVSIGDDNRMIIQSLSMSLGGSRIESSDKSEFKMPEIKVTQGDRQTLPIIFIEDAGPILMRMNDGNTMMQNLRNRTDGIIKDHPVKIVFTTNEETSDDFDHALLRDGRCYGFFSFPKLTPAQAVEARKAAGMPDFEEVPTNNVPLATALREPRKKIFIDQSSKRFFAQ